MMSTVNDSILDLLTGGDQEYRDMVGGTPVTDLKDGTYEFRFLGFRLARAPFRIGKDQDAIERPGMVVQARYADLQTGREYEGEAHFIPAPNTWAAILPTLPETGRGNKFGVKASVQWIGRATRRILNLDRPGSPEEWAKATELAGDNLVVVQVRISTDRPKKGGEYKRETIVEAEVHPLTQSDS